MQGVDKNSKTNNLRGDVYSVLNKSKLARELYEKEKESMR